MLYTKSATFRFYKNKVVVVNTENGRWIRMSKECYEIINWAIENQISTNMLIDMLEDKKDKSIMTELLDNLIGLNIISDSTENVVQERLWNPKVHFAITNRCNLSCTHCIAAAGSAADEEYLNTNEVLMAITRIKECNPWVISFTGGEPLLRPDFPEILSHTYKGFSGKIVVMTNGTLINIEIGYLLAKYANSVDISIDGIDEESCSRIRGPGVFSKVISGVEQLKQTGNSKITLSMVLTNYNLPLVDKFYKLNAELGTTPLLRAFTPLGRGKQYRALLAPSIYNHDYVQVMRKESRPVISLCKAGRDEFALDYRGDIYPCLLLQDEQFKLGNICEVRDLTDCLSNDKAYKNVMNSIGSLEKYSNSVCENCEVNLFCWTCPNTFLRIFNNPSELQVHCMLHRERLFEQVWGEEGEDYHA